MKPKEVLTVLEVQEDNFFYQVTNKMNDNPDLMKLDRKERGLISIALLQMGFRRAHEE